MAKPIVLITSASGRIEKKLVALLSNEGTIEQHRVRAANLALMSYGKVICGRRAKMR